MSYLFILVLSFFFNDLKAILIFFSVNWGTLLGLVIWVIPWGIMIRPTITEAGKLGLPSVVEAQTWASSWKF